MTHSISNSIFRLTLTTITALFCYPGFAGLQEGVAAYEANNFPLALKEFRSGAETNDSNCQYNLALMYERGIAVPKDEKEARNWYRKAAELGNPNAQFNLGVFYENGLGGGVDFSLANQWYRKAALQGDALAIGNLGMLYVRGDGVKTNKIAGMALLLRSATLDSSPENYARQNLAAVRGVTAETFGAAQKLSAEMSSAKNLLEPLDQFLNGVTNAVITATNSTVIRTNPVVEGK